MVFLYIALIFSIFRGIPASAETAAGICHDSLSQLKETAADISGAFKHTDEENCKNWTKSCEQFTHNLPKEDRSDCTVEPIQSQMKLRKTDCVQGILDAVSGSVLGPYYLTMAASDFVKSVNSSCQGYTKEYKEALGDFKKYTNQLEYDFMQHYYGATPPGTWESLSCDQMADIRLCQGYDPNGKTDLCKTAFTLKTTAEARYSESVYGKPGTMAQGQTFEIVHKPQEMSGGIIQSRLKTCSDFKDLHKSDWTKTSKEKLKAGAPETIKDQLDKLRESIAKDGSCKEAFDSIMAGLNNSMLPAAYSENQVT